MYKFFITLLRPPKKKKNAKTKSSLYNGLLKLTYIIYPTEILNSQQQLPKLSNKSVVPPPQNYKSSYNMHYALSLEREGGGRDSTLTRAPNCKTPWKTRKRAQKNELVGERAATEFRAAESK